MKHRMRIPAQVRTTTSEAKLVAGHSERGKQEDGRTTDKERHYSGRVWPYLFPFHRSRATATNVRGQAGRTNALRQETEAQNRPCLHRVCSAAWSHSSQGYVAAVTVIRALGPERIKVPSDLSKEGPGTVLVDGEKHKLT